MKPLGKLLGLWLATTGTTVTAAAIPAKKITITRTNWNCDGILVSPMTDPFGFVNLVKPTSGNLVAAIVLQGATSTATYKVRLLQVPRPSPCYDNVPSTSLVMDSSGYGITNFQQPLDPTTKAVSIDLNNLADPNNDSLNPDNFKIPQNSSAGKGGGITRYSEVGLRSINYSLLICFATEAFSTMEIVIQSVYSVHSFGVW